MVTKLSVVFKFELSPSHYEFGCSLERVDVAACNLKQLSSREAPYPIVRHCPLVCSKFNWLRALLVLFLAASFSSSREVGSQSVEECARTENYHHGCDIPTGSIILKRGRRTINRMKC